MRNTLISYRSIVHNSKSKQKSQVAKLALLLYTSADVFYAKLTCGAKVFQAIEDGHAFGASQEQSKWTVCV